ncbi:MAG: M20/M25/M40 family metallo-hydrolase [Dehalococcoidia bacterium]|nr:M20/M25/M40 family metallo-hydrolase [Dehalococcoidia bacterium]
MDHVKITGDLVSIDTTVPPGRNYMQALDYLEPLFRQAGLETERVNIPAGHSDGFEPRVNLLCHRRAPGKPRLIFYTHIDVVPAEGWDAFTPRIEQGKLYGRGAADMKRSIAGLLLGLEAAGEKPPEYDISVMVTTDEEAGQPNQVRYLRQRLEPVAGALFFSLDASSGYVGITNLGALHMDIRVSGRSVHSGLSHLGENAVEKASLLVQSLLKLKEDVVRRKSSVPVHPRTGLETMEPRLNINVIQGGLKVNIVPDQCLVSVDRRLIPEEDLEAARKELLDALNSVPGVRWEIEKTVAMPPVPPTTGPEIDRLASIIEEVTGDTGKFGEMGSGDLPHIVYNEWGGKEFGLGVIRSECNIHGVNEFVYLKDIEDLGRIIARFLSG